MTEGGSEERLTFLYNLRAVVVFLIVVLHGSMIYMTYAPEWWYVVDTNTSLSFTFFALLLDVPLFLILLFIAGFFVYPSLYELRANGFMRSSIHRIAMPWIIGIFLLAPPIGFLTLYSRDTGVPYALFLEEHFWKDYFTQSVYWFLGILLMLYAAVTLLYYSSPAFRSINLNEKHPTWTNFAIFLTAMSVGCFVINLTVPIDQWRHYGYLFMMQPVRLPLYAGFFYLGFYAFKNGWFRVGGYLPDFKLWITLSVYSGILYLIARILVERGIGPELAANTVVILTLNLFSFPTLLAMIGGSRQYLNNRSAFWKNQARNWYGMYYIHPLILFPAALYALPMEISVFIKAPVVILISWLITWLISSVILTRAPFLREIF